MLVLFLALLSVIVLPYTGRAQIHPPKPGVDMPQAYFDRIKEDRDAFKFRHAWIDKTKRIKQNRERYIEERGFYNRQLLSPSQAMETSVSGTVRVPVFMVKYANTGADPYPTSTLATKLFTGPFSPQTMTQMYAEMSYGDINLTGTVYGWTTLANNDTYYEGGCQGLCGTANVDELIIETLNANDAAVDFGQYDNDGPDGIANSGDDDGYVDFAAFVQPETGGECGTSNIWSHRWYLEGWGNLGWTSNDPRTGGGFIKVSDYTIQPALNCGGASVIDIGVFCHEFGHAFGLPDLYDTNGGSEGIGHWGLMGSGSWNTVTQPAHMCAWSKNELGWTNVVVVEGQMTPYSMYNVEQNRPIYRLGVMEERWRRSAPCAISGTSSMHCGLTAAEATARHWVSGEGYGNGWDERVERNFHYNGSGSVTLEYDYDYESEVGYDYTYGRIDVGGTVSTFATYNNVGSGHAVIDLTPYLSGPTNYTVFFEFESDGAWSDEDGSNATTCGAFTFDNVSVNGGGVSYFTDFETRENGWHADMMDPAEKFYVENRQPIGSDVNLHGGGGLCIWHIDESAAHGTGNSGGSSGLLPHGVKLMEADNLNQLASGANRGDSGDHYPGSASNMLLNNATSPNSISYNNQPTTAVVQLTSGSGDPMTANMRGGWFAPSYTDHNPKVGDNNQTVLIAVDGGGMAYGMNVRLVMGATVISPTSVVWIGHDLVTASFDLNGATGGDYDLVMTNPINATHVEAAAFHVNDVISGVETPSAPDSYSLGQNFPNPFNPTTVIPFDIKETVHATLKIYNLRGQVVRTLVDGTLTARSYAIPWNGDNDAGRVVASGVYFYKLTAGDFQDVRKLVLMK